MMKSAYALSLAVAYVNAQAPSATANCSLVFNCKDGDFLNCFNYAVEPASSCDIYTFSDSLVKWDTPDIEVQYWPYHLSDDADEVLEHEEYVITGSDLVPAYQVVTWTEEGHKKVAVHELGDGH